MSKVRFKREKGKPEENFREIIAKYSGRAPENKLKLLTPIAGYYAAKINDIMTRLNSGEKVQWGENGVIVVLEKIGEEITCKRYQEKNGEFVLQETEYTDPENIIRICFGTEFEADCRKITEQNNEGQIK